MNHDDELLLRELLCGDVSEHDPTVAARLAAAPALRARLAALRDAERTLVNLGNMPADLAAEAALLVEPADRERVAAALRPPVALPKSPARDTGRSTARRLRWFALVGLAAAAILAFMIAGGKRAPEPDGRLGGIPHASLKSHDGRWTLTIDDALPPGASYDLRLELADGTSSTATGDSRTWQFPDAWNAAVGRARTGKLTIECDDGTGLLVRRTLSLP